MNVGIVEGVTVTEPLPETVPTHVVETLTNEYVLVVVGETAKVYGEEAIPEIVVVVEPSE